MKEEKAMAVRVQIPGPLRALAGGAAEVQVQADTVAGLVDALQSAHAGFRERLLDGSGKLRSYVRVFVNEDDVRSLAGEDTPLRDGDVVAIVPAIAGGACCCCRIRARSAAVDTMRT
jgi:molybdopterin synthase sulfur carrier subunit